jgi:RNA polymerase sigma factor (sigma-70 family)
MLDARPGHRVLRVAATAADDRLLMARVVAGDADAFDTLLRAHWAATGTYARSLAVDPDAADDIIQEAFVRLWRARATWKPGGSVRVWLFRTVRNLWISEHRRRRVRDRWAASRTVADLPRPRSPLEAAESAELRAAISDTVAELSPRRREVFTLFHVQDLSYREIAEVMGIREQSVANHLQAAVARLRHSLRSYFPALRRDEVVRAAGDADE